MTRSMKGVLCATASRTAVVTLMLGAGALLGGCGDDDAGRDVASEEQSMEPDETAGEALEAFAALSFASAADDARLRCLLETIEAEGMSAGLRTARPIEDMGELRRTWCTDLQANGSACLRGMLDAVAEPGARALSTWARRPDASSAVEAYGYRTVRNPAEGGTSDVPAWSLYFERSYGGTDEFLARFVPFAEDGRDMGGQLVVGDRLGYRGEGITVTFPTDGTPAELLGRLVESPERFESVLTDRYDTVLAEFERRVADEPGLDAAARERALADARTFFGTRRDVVTENAARFHELLSEQVALDRCG